MKLLKLIVEYVRFEEKTQELDKELQAIAHEYYPYISLHGYEDKGWGKITFRHRDDIPKDVFAKVVDWAKSKGFEIEQESNWYDYEPGERDYYPTISLRFEVGQI